MTKPKQAGPLEAMLGWKLAESMQTLPEDLRPGLLGTSRGFQLCQHMAKHLAKSLTMADLQAAGLVRPPVMRARRGANSVDLLRNQVAPTPAALEHNPDEQD